MSKDVDWTHPHVAFGIDIGGSGIKGAPVDLSTGELLAKRRRVPTPQPSTTQAVAQTVAQLVGEFSVPESVPIGVTFPGIVKDGRIASTANVDQSWQGVSLPEILGQSTSHRYHAVNDADAAGLAEARFGAAFGQPGLAACFTLGTGIGSALLLNGQLVPNTELGHLEIDGHDAEDRAASSVKDNEGLTYPQWAARLQRYFEVIEFLFSPDLIVVGGGVSKDHEKFLPLLKLQTPIVPAKLRNNAGIVGAAAMVED